MKHPKPRNHFHRESVPIHFADNGRTEQKHKHECDINHIMAKYHKTGILEHANRHAGTYADYVGYDFQEAQFQQARAITMYEELPSLLRKKFDGPGDFLNYATDEANADEMRELGLLPPISNGDEPEPPAASERAKPDKTSENGETDEK